MTPNDGILSDRPALHHKLWFILYFALSALFTWWFVTAAPVYISTDQMLLSTAIAGGKWGLQILLAFFLLQDKKWIFLRNIGYVCFLGSCILLPYVFLSYLGITNSMKLFIASLAIAVLAMVFQYYYAMKKAGLRLSWWLCWVICLAVAISLQLTIVFHVISL